MLNDDLDQSGRLFYVGPQMRQSGRLAGELMGRYLNGKGNIIIINNCSVASVNYYERIEGFNEVIKENYKNINVISTYSYRFESLKNNLDYEIQLELESIDNIAGIYDADGASLFNIGAYVKSRGLKNRFVIIGHEIWDEVEKMLAEDIIQVCINQDPYASGYYAVKLLIEYLLKGRKKPPYERFYTHVDIIIKENLPSQENILRWK